MIELRGLTKRFGATTAVDGVSLDVLPGRVTGFLGPNGAGKTTTMRMILGLDAPTAGTATVNGRSYAALPVPLREVGALLDAAAVHPGRSARSHLRAMARSNRIPVARVDELLESVGIASVAHKRVKTYSLGMRQRLGIAGALLGDPGVLLFDEPVNGLDPEGVRWVRQLARRLADEGRTVLLSSHLMSEMQQTADHLVVIGRGHVLADRPLDELIAGAHGATVVVATPDGTTLTGGLRSAGATVTPLGGDRLQVVGLPPARVGDLAHDLGVRLHELTGVQSTLEQVYLELTDDSVQFRGASEPAAVAAPAGGRA